MDPLAHVLADERASRAFSYLQGPVLAGTASHSERVARDAIRAGEALDACAEDVVLLGYSLLHDIGKALVPSHILCKRGSLSPDERVAMARHTELGGALLEDIGLSGLPALFARSHHSFRKTDPQPIPRMGTHERWLARIVSIVDMIDALSEERVYRPAMEQDHVLQIVFHEYGTDDATRTALRLRYPGIGDL